MKARIQAELLLARFGAGWPLALLAVVAAALVNAVALKPSRFALDDARQRLSLARVAGRATPAPAVHDDAQQIAALRAAFPPASEATRQIAALDAIARQHQIVVAQSEYSRRLHAETGLVQVQVLQPIKAPYPKVKSYVQAVLRSMPNVSLEQVAARRENVGQSDLEVRLRWTLWLQPIDALETRP